jgi:prepilin-type N-terminal cleavage/methylation domain-containing protein
MNPGIQGRRGFSLIEMLVVVALFTLITGVVFQMLDLTQRRHRAEADLLDSFQGARLAIDQITRDIHASGYPPANQFIPGANAARFAIPFGFSPNYPATPGCAIGATCLTPGQFDLIVEADIDPENCVPAALNCIEWIRYRLNGRILERGVAQKTAGADPAVATLNAGMTPFIENVLNNTTAAEMNQIRTFYPAMFPGNAPVPVFRYMCQTGTGAVLPCTVANGPSDIREVEITLIVRSPSDDPRNRQPRALALTARARRMNPNQ